MNNCILNFEFVHQHNSGLVDRFHLCHILLNLVWNILRIICIKHCIFAKWIEIYCYIRANPVAPVIGIIVPLLATGNSVVGAQIIKSMRLIKQIINRNCVMLCLKFFRLFNS